MTEHSADSLLQVDHLRVQVRIGRRYVSIVDDLNFQMQPGEIVALVGESGSGKSMTALAIMRLLKSPPMRMSGRVLLDSHDLMSLHERKLSSLRGSLVSMVFQDPLSSLDPLYRVGDQLVETVLAHRKTDKAAARAMSLEALRRVGIPDPERRLKAYPHELSGGMRQRVMIALSVLLPPKLLIADEPTTALDVTVQAQILDLIAGLQRDLGMAVLLITHNLALAAEYAQRLMVMYAGEIVEAGPTAMMLSRPQHPYTQALLDCVPSLDRVRPMLRAISGNVPDPQSIPPACRFHPRCRYVLDRCSREHPTLSLAEPGHVLRCWNPQSYAPD